MDLDALYANRFAPADAKWRANIWEVLWDEVFSRYVAPTDVLLDVGGGYCEFINAAKAARRITVDLNPETERRAAPGVEVHSVSAEKLDFLGDGQVDVAFSSNFFEHLPDKEGLQRVIREIHRVLKPGGRLLAMGPNIRFLAGQYWDFFDHHVPLSDRSMSELLQLEKLEVERVEPRFMPYTTKSATPRWPWLVRAYLKALPLSGLFLGKQFFVVARKPAGGATAS